jgi:hypothetical protein
MVNHIDGNKQNNVWTNLEWMTASENAQHSVNILKNSYKPNQNGYKKIDRINIETNEIITYESIKDTIEKNNITQNILKTYLDSDLVYQNVYKFKIHTLEEVDLTEFVDIIDCPGYKIANDGRIYSTKTQMFLTARCDDSYPHVSLYINSGMRKKCFIHVLVAKHFIPNPNEYKVVNHLNGIKTCFHYMNLEWTTQQCNMKHSISMKKKITVLTELLERFTII